MGSNRSFGDTGRNARQRIELLGLDIGSTVIKAVVFDTRGCAVASAQRSVPVRRPQPGWVERDANGTWRAAATVIRQAVRGRAGRIAAVGVTGCGNGAVFLDRAGSPLRAGILSSDTRAGRFLRRMDRSQGQQPYAGQLPSLLAWFRAAERVPARRLACVLFWKDFIRLRLTGVACTDVTDAGAAGLLNYPGRSYRAADAALPPLRESLAGAGAVTLAAGARTGLRPGTPVYAGCIDCEAAALGSGVRGRGEVSVVAGTWSINQTYVTRSPRRPRHFLVNASVEPGRWLVLEGSPTSAANFDWARRALGGATLGAARAMAEAARAPRGGAQFLPQMPAGRGAFVGLGPQDDRGTLLRAVLEGVGFAHRAHLEALAASAGQWRRVTLSGGVAQSPFWCQLFANILGCPVDVSDGSQPGALGAALCAGVGAGLWPTVPAAQRALVPRKRTYLPDPLQYALLNRDYARYRRHVRLLTP